MQLIQAIDLFNKLKYKFIPGILETKYRFFTSKSHLGLSENMKNKGGES